MLLTNSDWSENGDVPLREQVQSEYLRAKFYLLLVMIVAFLRLNEWKDRVSLLRTKDEVTIQPADAPPLGSCEYVQGSYVATVSVGQDILYIWRGRDL